MTFTKWGCVSGLVSCVVRPTGCSARVAERYRRAEEAVNTLPATAVSGGRAGWLYVAGGGCFRAGVGRLCVAGMAYSRVWVGSCTLREASVAGGGAVWLHVAGGAENRGPAPLRTKRWSRMFGPSGNGPLYTNRYGRSERSLRAETEACETGRQRRPPPNNP